MQVVKSPKSHLPPPPYEAIDDYAKFVAMTCGQIVNELMQSFLGRKATDAEIEEIELRQIGNAIETTNDFGVWRHEKFMGKIFFKQTKNMNIGVGFEQSVYYKENKEK